MYLVKNQKAISTNAAHVSKLATVVVGTKNCVRNFILDVETESAVADITFEKKVQERQALIASLK